MGFTQPTQSPESLVRSYRTVSPLPGKSLPTSLHDTLQSSESFRRFAFCCTCPILADGGRYPPSCPKEPGLSSPSESDAANAWPSAASGCSLSGPATPSEVMLTELRYLFEISSVYVDADSYDACQASGHSWLSKSRVAFFALAARNFGIAPFVRNSTQQTNVFCLRS